MTKKSCESLTLLYIYLDFAFYVLIFSWFIFCYFFGTFSSAFPFNFFQSPSKCPSFQFLPQGRSSSHLFFLLPKYSLPCRNKLIIISFLRCGLVRLGWGSVALPMLEFPEGFPLTALPGFRASLTSCESHVLGPSSYFFVFGIRNIVFHFRSIKPV